VADVLPEKLPYCLSSLLQARETWSLKK